MTDIAIRIQNLSKCYQIFATPRDRLKQFVLPGLHGLVGKEYQRCYREFWALNDVSFDVKKGETIGIVGRNGSGKSTLLQLICGTLFATSGLLETEGRIAALLELGTGFNPEFTGRENVFLNGAIIGLTREEISTRFDDIVTFADIGDFIDRPVKTYSSGMIVRLAFAVAINVDPQILVVDEALSVGDELFQRKCFARIEAIKKSGATILFVTHSGGTVVELCDRAILLDGGEQLATGIPKQIVAKYQRLLYAPDEERMRIREEIRSSGDEAVVVPSATSALATQNDHAPDSVVVDEFFDPNLKPQSTVEYASRGAKIEAPEITDANGRRVNMLRRGEVYRYNYVVSFDRQARNTRFGMLIKTISGVELGGAVSAPTAGEGIQVIEAGSRMQVSFAFRCALSTGSYFLNAGVVGQVADDEEYLHRVLDAHIFKVLPEPAGTQTGMVDFYCVPDVIALPSKPAISL